MDKDQLISSDQLLSSMTKGEIVDEIVIDANMGLQWPLRCPWTFVGS